MIIGLLGVRGSGKDYTALKLKQDLEKQGKTVAIVGFSDGVRDVTFNELGLDITSPDWDYDRFKEGTVLHMGIVKTGRGWLEYFGETLRRQYPLYWSNMWIKKVKCMSHDVIIATDCRFTHEIMAVEAVSNGDSRFMFCNYKSGRYDDSICKTNELALEIRSWGFPDQGDVTHIFSI